MPDVPAEADRGSVEHPAPGDRFAWTRSAAMRIRGRRPPFALCYHGIGPVDRVADPHGLLVPETRFAEHLDQLLQQGHRLVGVDALWSAIEADPGVMAIGAITFDDGLAKTLETVVRMIAGRPVKVTAYIPPGLLGQPHPHLADGQRIVDAGQLRELAEVGVEIGAHSVDHSDLRTLDYAGALEQLRRSRGMLEDLLGRPVTGMAYPFGSFDEETMAAAQEAGYRTACACSGPGRWRGLALPREPVFPATSTRRLRLKIAGLYGPVHELQEARSRLSKRRRRPSDPGG